MIKNNVWNIILSALATTILSVLGYVLITMINIQQYEAAQKAVDFNSRDAAILQRELTDIMTDIDMRIRLIERDIQWIKINSKQFDSDIPMQWAPAPSPDPDPSPPPPRYKLDVKQEKK